ncbi:MAG: TRAP transporter small permease [Rhodoferax sp.]|uniref:TRAP transporter small permease n=1 Tax=Rhodoferax sp. TaxID=50421 RepID=UPI0008D538D9|nr:TRAP transporter small permease [Rhodoferax sp.]MDP2679258.1 TRAP transporter small permease [Rhodoferax sp.]OGB50014.1 MAG: C4-dicarboxylate ABC transporter substrate-binding protein [Burkholderiales bacterium RIFOXYD12_FULL_59_19]OGB75307.1 MAG: C4-dicarboxylate ABC transporter substrate-binding protein [Burkholderiales bacterium RIFOXYC12_FULL_60_6]
MKILDSLEEWIVTLLIGAATMITFAAVVHRYTIGFGIPGLTDWLISIDMSWAQELTIIMFVWMAKFGAAYGVRTGIHVGVDVLINRLKPDMRFKFIVFGLLAGAVFTGIVAALGAHFVWENGAHYGIFHALGLGTDAVLEGPTTVDLEMPTWMVYSAIPLGSSLMCFRFMQVCVAFLKTGELPHHDHSVVEGVEAVQDADVADDLHPQDMQPNKNTGDRS